MWTYVFVRTDIPLEDQLCQVGHACLVAGKEFGAGDRCNIVLNAVRTQSELLHVADYLYSNKILFSLYEEPDENMGHTALCTQEVPIEKKELFKKYNCWK